MEVICLEDAAFYTLIEQVVERLRQTHGAEREKWVSDEHIKSRTTLQKYRVEGRVHFSQPQKKIILYDRGLIRDFPEKNAFETSQWRHS